MSKFYYPGGHAPEPNPEAVIGTACTSCGAILTAENLSVCTDKAGTCQACVPKGPPTIPTGMVQP